MRWEDFSFARETDSSMRCWKVKPAATTKRFSVNIEVPMALGG